MPSFFSYLLIAVLLHRAYTALFNLYWHPLAGFPGPFLRCAFALPDALSTLRGHQYLEIQRMHARYGHVVRIAPNSLSYSTPTAWGDIYGLKSNRSELAKDPTYYKRTVGVQLLNANQTEHTFMRKAIGPFFSDTSLLQREELLNSYFDLFVTKLMQKVEDDDVNSDGAKIDLMAYFNFVTFDIIGDLVLGEPFGALESGHYHTWIRNVFESIKMLGVLRLAANYSLVRVSLGLLQYCMPSLAAKRQAHMKFTQEKVHGRLSGLSVKPDLIAHLSKNANSTQTFTPAEILSNCRVLLTAGSETVATNLTGVIWLLLKHPKKLKRAQDEVRSNFESTSNIRLQDLSRAEQLPYLYAVIQEGLRCYPPVPSILPRITNKGGNEIAGRYVPGGVSVGVHQWSTYRHPDNFHLPNEFIPERWLPDAADGFRADARDALQPFHVGPRGCLGKSLAYYEIRSILIRLLWHFDLDLHPQSATWMEGQKEHALWDKPSLWVNIRKRRS